MKKTIIGLSLVAMLHAQTYEELLEQAISNNLNLQLMQNRTEVIKIEGKIDTRFQNPNVELEIADFSAKRLLRKNEIGARTGISQELLLPWVKRDKKILSKSKVNVAYERYNLEKLAFIYEFNSLYIEYKKAIQKETLAQEGIVISTNILTIAQARFNAGGSPRSELLQAQIEEQNAQSLQKRLGLERVKAKNRLLLFANLDSSSTVEGEHLFVPSQESNVHPLLNIAQQEQDVAKLELHVASHSIETIELFSEIEAEPDQDVFRVGLSIALPLFNNKSEEKQLAKLKLNSQKLAFSIQERALQLEIEQLQNEVLLEEEMKSSYAMLLTEQEKLLDIYEQGYRVAKVNLLKLNSLKKELLLNREQILERGVAIEQKNIKISYLQGAYSE